MSRREEFISDARRYNRMIWDALAGLRALQREWNALDYGTTLGDTSGAPAADVGAVVFDTTNAFDAQLNAGHATNIAKLL